MTVSIPIDVLFFIIPIAICIFMGQKHSNASGYMGSSRDWFYMFAMPVALLFSFASWAIWLKWFAP